MLCCLYIAHCMYHFKQPVNYAHAVNLNSCCIGCRQNHTSCKYAGCWTNMHGNEFTQNSVICERPCPRNLSESYPAHTADSRYNASIVSMLTLCRQRSQHAIGAGTTITCMHMLSSMFSSSFGPTNVSAAHRLYADDWYRVAYCLWADPYSYFGY